MALPAGHSSQSYPPSLYTENNQQNDSPDETTYCGAQMNAYRAGCLAGGTIMLVYSVPLLPALCFTVGAGLTSNYVYNKITARHAEPANIATQLTNDNNDNKAKAE